MNTLTINLNELSALSGLPHLQQLLYLRGIRPYVDYQTNIVGMKRGVSYQSFSEALYIEPHQGIKGGSPSKDQLRRALKGLERAGILEIRSLERKLVFKCSLVQSDFSAQKKPAIKSHHEEVRATNASNSITSRDIAVFRQNAIPAHNEKAAIPLKDNNYYIFLLSQFEKFWDLYPMKKAKQNAWEAFQALNPAPELMAQINSALALQIQFHQRQQSHGLWVAAWKYPANWLTQQCWEDEIQIESPQEKNNAIHTKHNSKHIVTDSFWESCKSGFEEEADDSNVIYFGNVRRNT